MSSFGSVQIPDHLDTIIDLVTGINELVRPSLIRPRTKKLMSQRSVNTELNDVSLGYIIPWGLRNMYKLPNTFWISPKASIVTSFSFRSYISNFNSSDHITNERGVRE
jgi:hypothetical protein